ncbi:hypothetical protein BT69DRAFT_1156184 [Atractiella rhizophila]|nr:hypothetical protein BT69DRAFT_1156184 [Atractiella rhizophila]
MPQNFPSRFEYPKHSTYQPQGSPEYRPRPFPPYRPPPRPVSSEFFYGVKQEAEQDFFPMKPPAMEQRRNPPLYPQVHPALQRLELTPVLYSTPPPLADRIGRTNIPRPSFPSAAGVPSRSFLTTPDIRNPRFSEQMENMDVVPPLPLIANWSTAQQPLPSPSFRRPSGASRSFPYHTTMEDGRQLTQDLGPTSFHEPLYNAPDGFPKETGSQNINFQGNQPSSFRMVST